MDINYILSREQVSLHRASVAASAPARIAHQGLATAYGQLLIDSSFPHRIPIALQFRPAPLDDINRWEDDGGQATSTAYDRAASEGAPANALPLKG
ncbi:hypothetical protein SOM26_00860 [Sphingomonas sp. CFBP8993]|uniref:hypothetical protein n=1 Tax=Sphingomonas sp. CFBP8993 TaxID=3096526 RepID=UPI002A6B7677|nr:hypothetical protein [Sphingomonas sp. CFBP8993]MDY0957228.1 hypothetical protein [Sphingomonas sp. CFBP8993]